MLDCGAECEVGRLQETGDPVARDLMERETSHYQGQLLGIETLPYRSSV